MYQPAVVAQASLFSALDPDKNCGSNLTPLNFQTVHVSTLSSQEGKLPNHLRGTWYSPGHPLFGPSVWTFSLAHNYIGVTTSVHGTHQYEFKTITAIDYGLPGSVSVLDTTKNRVWLHFLHKHGLSWAFPSFSDHVLPAENTTHLVDSWVLTKMHPPFDVFPLPAYMSEAFPGDAAKVFHGGPDGGVWDPDLSDTVTRCECQLNLFEDKIDRLNFGEKSYSLYRIVDQHGTTKWFSHFAHDLLNVSYIRISSAKNDP